MALNYQNEYRINNRDNSRELIGRQIDSLRQRSRTFTTGHPAQMGITRTIERLSVEESAAD